MFGYAPGTLGPVGYRAAHDKEIVRVFDTSLVKEWDFILCGAGERDTMFRLATQCLHEVSSVVQVANISTHSTVELHS